MKICYDNLPPEPTALEIKEEQQMILKIIAANHKELERAATQLSKEELEHQFSYSTDKS